MNAIIKSEAVIQFSDLEIPDLTKWNNLGLFGQLSLDNVVAAFLSGGMCYLGLDCGASTSSNGAPLVNIGPGLFYRSGIGYALRDTGPLDLGRYVAQVPDAAKTLNVLIVVDGSEGDVNGDETFLDQNRRPADPNVAWPTTDIATSLMKVRSVVPSPVGGAADVQPVDGDYNTTLLLPIARVVVGNTGILSVTQITDGRITTQAQLTQIVGVLGPQVAAYKTAIAGLLSTTSALTLAFGQLRDMTAAQIAALQAALNALETRQVAGSTPGIVLNVTDYYTDGTGLTVQANPAYAVGSGLTFPQGPKNPGSLIPLNEYGPNIKLVGGRYVTLPYTAVTSKGTSEGTNIYASPDVGFHSTFLPNGPWSVTPLLEAFGVARTRYGASYQAQAAAQILASGDPTLLFALNAGDLSYNPSFGDWRADAPEISHQNGYWHDLTSRGFWTPRTAGAPTGAAYALSQVRQTNYDDMLLAFSVLIPGDTLNLGGDLRLLICGDKSGNPDPANVVMDLTIPGAHVADGGGYATFNMPYPLLRKAGVRMHYVLLNSVGYKFRLSSSHADPTAQTLLALSTDALSWQQNPGNYQLLYQEDTASFTLGGAPIELPLLSLGGGIEAINILLPAIVPAGCDVLYGTIPSGSATYTRFGPIDPTNPASNLLAGHPSQLRLFLDLQATTKLAPVVDLQPSAAGNAGNVIDRRSGTLTAQSPVRTPPSSVTKITRSVSIAGFNPAVHTYTELLATGTGFSVLKNPDVTGAPVAQPDGTTLFTFSWQLGAAVPSFMVDYNGTTSDTTQIFRIVKSITTAAT